MLFSFLNLYFCSLVRHMNLGQDGLNFQARSQNSDKRQLASSCMSARPCDRMEQRGSHWRDFREISYFCFFFQKFSRKSSFMKSYKNICYFTSRPMYIFDHISLSFSQNDKCSRQIYRENRNTHFVFNNFLVFENHVVQEIVWKKMLCSGAGHRWQYGA